MKVLPVNVTVEGAVLRGAVYVPPGDAPKATILRFGPYWGDYHAGAALQLTEPKAQRSFLDNATAAGFAVAYVNIRGTGDSSGCFSMSNLQDAPDGRAVIEWLANQTWSNGAVGMYGGSYDGWTQDLVQRDPPPQLKAIIPQSSIEDDYALVTAHGAPMDLPSLVDVEWTFGVGLGTFGVAGPVVDGKGLNPNPDPSKLHPGHLCEDSVYTAADSQALLATGDRTPYYIARDNRHAIATHQIPTFVTNGFGPGEAHYYQIDGRWDLMQGPKRMAVGYWPHVGQATVLHDWNQQALAWYDHYLRGGPDRLPSGVVEFVDDAGGFHNTTAWPPPGMSTSVLHLAGMQTAPGPSIGTLDPNPQANGQATVAVSPESSLWGDECNVPQASYLGPPVTQDVLIAGYYTINATLTSTMPDSNLAAALYAVPASATGCDEQAVRPLRLALADLAHRGGHQDVGSPFPIGQPTRVSWPSMPLAGVVHKGERLLLVVSGGEATRSQGSNYVDDEQTGTSGVLMPKPYSGTLALTDGTLTVTTYGSTLDFAS